MTRIWVCCSIVSPWTLHRWAHSWKQPSWIKKYASDLSIAFVLSKWRYYPAAMFAWILTFADMSGTKFNIRLHFVFLQSQWSHFCFWRQPRQHPIPRAMATIQKVRTITRAMHCPVWGWTIWDGNKIPLLSTAVITFPQDMIIMCRTQRMHLLDNSLLYRLVITGSQWTPAAPHRNLWLIVRLYKHS